MIASASQLALLAPLGIAVARSFAACWGIEPS
jgi:hypothetical protein